MSSPAGRVAWITIAPIKGLRLVRRSEVRLEQFGVPADRRFVLIDGDGRLVNGKRVPTLLAVIPDYDEAAGSLALRFPDGSIASGAVELESKGVEVRFSSRSVPGHPVRGPFAATVSDHAGIELRLVRLDEPGQGVDRPGGAATILSVAALDGLAAEAGIEGWVDERRFRMLFGVDGVPAHAEDGWIDRPVRFGEAVLVPTGNVGRCAVTTRDPDTGEPDIDTLRILARYRAGDTTTERLPFGVWARVRVPGVVRVGDGVAPLPE